MTFWFLSFLICGLSGAQDCATLHYRSPLPSESDCARVGLLLAPKAVEQTGGTVERIDCRPRAVPEGQG